MTTAHHLAPRSLTGMMVCLLFCAVLAGCTTAIRESNALLDQGRWQEALARLEQGMKENPRDPELRIHYFHQRELALGRALLAAGAEAAAGRLDTAEEQYRQVLAVDPVNSRAVAGLEALVVARRHRLLIVDARTKVEKGDTLSADLIVKGILAENASHPEARALDRELRERERRKSLTPPVLKSRLQNPVTLEFRDAPLKTAFEAISRSSGINFVFDRDLRPDLRTTVFVRNARVEDAIEMMLGPNQLEKKVLSENTVLIYPNTPQKLRENQELVMRAFHLGNADPKQTINMIRTMLKTKDMFVDERVNMLVMRDTPDAVRLAEKLIVMQDLAEPEVVLELEILEVSRNKVRDLGIAYPSEFTGPTGTLASIKDLSEGRVGANSGYAIKLLRTDGDTRTLANPRVRVRNREKAKVHVGDRVPVISSTLVGAGSSAPVSSEQIQYLDVGIKVDAEPTVHPDDSVAVKINLDVSSLGAQTRTAAGTTAYEVGTRNVSTVLRLRDGETQALMGLIRDDDNQTRAGLPFVGEMPVLDRIFGSTRTDLRNRELVLLITPRIIRGHGLPDASLAEFWSGTEAALRARSPYVQSMEGPSRGGVAVPDTAPESTVGALSAAGQGAVPTADGSGGALALSWSAPGKLQHGRPAGISLNVASDVALKGVTVNLRFNPAELELLGLEDGGFFGREGRSSVFTPRVEPSLGMIAVTLGGSDGAVARGKGSLVTLRVRPDAKHAHARIELISVVGIDESGRQVANKRVDPFDVAIEP